MEQYISIVNKWQSVMHGNLVFSGLLVCVGLHRLTNVIASDVGAAQRSVLEGRQGRGCHTVMLYT